MFTNINTISESENKYEKIEKINSGNFGAVWKVKNKITGEYFAMKIMNEGIGSKSTSERQLIQEYNLKSVLKFSCKNNLTCYHEVFRIKNKLFLIMTMAEGKTLNFYMNKNTPTDIKINLKIYN